MKQEIITYLTTIKDTLYNLSKYLYDNPEESFHEYKAVEYITRILKENNFDVKDNFLEIPTSFYAQRGSGHPKICYICQYDAMKDKGHITGHNLVTTMSLGAALGLGKVIDKLGGSVVVLGCPGEYVGGSKITMIKQGVFEDIDIVLMAHPDIVTAESGTSSAILPLSVKYTGKETYSYMRREGYSALDACLFTFTGLTHLAKGFSEDVTIDGVVANGGNTPSIIPHESESRFYIRASSTMSAQGVENKIREFVSSVSSLMNIESDINYYELPYEELLTNKALSRIFCHNLKENGIIDCEGIQDIRAGMSIGNVSHSVPSIHPYISIVEDTNIKYSTPEFRDETISHYAFERIMNTTQTLAITGFDILSKEELLSEVRNEFYTNAKPKTS